MDAREFTHAVARVSGIRRANVAVMLAAVQKVAELALSGGAEAITIPGIGRLAVESTRPRSVRHPVTRELYHAPSRKRLALSPAPELMHAIGRGDVAPDRRQRQARGSAEVIRLCSRGGVMKLVCPADSDGGAEQVRR